MRHRFTVEPERETDGRWIADVPSLPGCLVSGATRDEGVSHVVVLGLHVLADRIEHGEPTPDVLASTFDFGSAFDFDATRVRGSEP